MAAPYENDDLVQAYQKLTHENQRKISNFLDNVYRIQRAETRVESRVRGIEYQEQREQEKLLELCKDSEGKLHCSFCGRKEAEDIKLICGPGVLICEECIDICNDILEEDLGRYWRAKYHKDDAKN